MDVKRERSRQLLAKWIYDRVNGKPFAVDIKSRGNLQESMQQIHAIKIKMAEKQSLPIFLKDPYQDILSMVEHAEHKLTLTCGLQSYLVTIDGTDIHAISLLGRKGERGQFYVISDDYMIQNVNEVAPVQPSRVGLNPCLSSPTLRPSKSIM